MKTPPPEELTLAPIFKGASDRMFYRVTTPDDHTFILIHYSLEKEENKAYASLAIFLREIGIAVPQLLHHCEEKCLMWFEDLGSHDLSSLKDHPWSERAEIYKNLLLGIRNLHREGLASAADRNLPLLPGFDLRLYEWEHHYFLENLVDAYFQLRLEDHEALSLGEELGRLKTKLLEIPPSLVHRDLQSHNVMIHRGKPYLIDFQGMREGAPFYDLGSLLYDPYVPFQEEERIELLTYYYHLDKENTLPWKDFLQNFREASAQRLMQALGAYGFIGLKRGKKEFLGHIRPALTNLIDATTRSESLPCLNRLASKLLEMETSR